MATLDSQAIQYEDRKVKAPKGSLVTRLRLSLQRRSRLVQENRRQRQELRASFENLTDPTFLDRIEQDKKEVSANV